MYALVRISKKKKKDPIPRLGINLIRRYLSGQLEAISWQHCVASAPQRLLYTLELQARASSRYNSTKEFQKLLSQNDTII